MKVACLETDEKRERRIQLTKRRKVIQEKEDAEVDIILYFCIIFILVM